MRVFIAVLVLIFSLQSWTKADDISDFQIEGMSIGDSALDYFSKKEINSGVKNYYKDKKFLSITIKDNFDLYEKIDFTYKPNDKKYKIYGIRGVKHFNNIKNCKIDYNKAVKDLSEMFKNSKKVDAGERNYSPDPTGKSKIYNVYFWLKKGGFIEVACVHMTEEFAKKNNWDNNVLTIGISAKEFSDFLINEEYK